MKYNKKQKRWLKKEGLWKKVKKYSKRDSDYINDPEGHGTLGMSFWWCNSKEGHNFWVLIDKRMHFDIGEL